LVRRDLSTDVLLSAPTVGDHTRGNLWFATECIPKASRTLLANWGTFIGKITVPKRDDR